MDVDTRICEAAIEAIETLESVKYLSPDAQLRFWRVMAELCERRADRIEYPIVTRSKQ